MKPIIMAHWSEIFGLVYYVLRFEDNVIAQIGKNPVIFPLEQEEKLRSLIGIHVAILCTDIPGKKYLFRVIREKSMESDSEVIAAENVQDEGDPI